MWGVVIDTQTISDFNKKYLELCVYASQNGHEKPTIGRFAEKMLDKENLDNLNMEEFFGS